MTESYATPQSSAIQNLFSNIASKYDLLNFLLSFGLDRMWRNAAVRKSLRETDKSILDVGTGSGKLLKAYCSRHSFNRAVGIDFCEPLLEKAKRDFVGSPEVSFRKINLIEMDLGDEKFDIISASFVLRSVADDLSNFFGNVHSALHPNGRFVILELTRPRNLIFNFLFQPYLKCYLPLLGKLISGNWTAYQFLAQSILHFKEREEVVGLLKGVGFSRVDSKLLTSGIATLFVAQR